MRFSCFVISFLFHVLAGAEAQSDPIEPHTGFTFHIEDAHLGHATGGVLREFAEEVGLGDVLPTRVIDGRPYVLDGDGRPMVMIAEWGYSGIRLHENEIDGAGLPRKGFPCFSSLQGCENPLTKQEAYERIRAYFEARRAAAEVPGSVLASMNGHYYFHHLAAEWGAEWLLSEVGENINGTQAHIAFTRGAARQYGRHWGIDMSAWYGPSINDYWAEEDRVWCQERDASGTCINWHSGPDHGHSISLFERIYYTSYMAGAERLVAEAGSVYFLASRQAPPALSPLGKMAQDFYGFTRQHPDRGQPYVPVAVVLDRYHGLGLGSWYLPEGKAMAWDWVPMSDAARDSVALLEALWPEAFEVMGRDESQYLVATPIGDTVDVLLEDAPLEVLLQYEVLIFSGDIDWNNALREKLAQCQERGVQVVLGVGVAPSEEARDFLQVHDAGEWPEVLQKLTASWPIQVSGEVQYLLNRREHTWVLTLINNQGITKQPREATKVDPAKRVEVVVRGKGQPLTGVLAWKATATPEVAEGILETTLGPGEIVILELTLAKGSP